MTIVSDDYNWCMYCKCVIAIAFALALARVINYTLRVMLQNVASLTLIIYNCNMFIVQATGEE